MSQQKDPNDIILEFLDAQLDEALARVEQIKAARAIFEIGYTKPSFAEALKSAFEVVGQDSRLTSEESHGIAKPIAPVKTVFVKDPILGNDQVVDEEQLSKLQEESQKGDAHALDCIICNLKFASTDETRKVCEDCLIKSENAQVEANPETQFKSTVYIGGIPFPKFQTSQQFLKNLGDMRRAKKLAQPELAAVISPTTHFTTISGMERGKYKGRNIEPIKKLATYFGVTISEFHQPDSRKGIKYNTKAVKSTKDTGAGKVYAGVPVAKPRESQSRPEDA